MSLNLTRVPSRFFKEKLNVHELGVKLVETNAIGQLKEVYFDSFEAFSEQFTETTVHGPFYDTNYHTKEPVLRFETKEAYRRLSQ